MIVIATYSTQALMQAKPDVTNKCVAFAMQAHTQRMSLVTRWCIYNQCADYDFDASRRHTVCLGSCVFMQIGHNGGLVRIFIGKPDLDLFCDKYMIHLQFRKPYETKDKVNKICVCACLFM